MTAIQPETRRRGAWLSDDDPAAQPKPSTPLWVVAVSIVGIVVYLGGFAYGIAKGDTNVFAGLIVAIPILLITAAIARWLARKDDDPSVFPLVMGAGIVKMLGALVRYWTAYSVYAGGIDASSYDQWGRTIAAGFRRFDPHFDVGGRLLGTNFIKLLTGIVYTFTPRARISGFMCFAFIGFIGLLFYWRAFKVAVPDGNVRKYAYLVLLLPSLVYWPSAIGKDAWMALTLGISAYGAAKLSVGKTTSGMIVALIGIAGVCAVRPHVGIAVFVGLAFTLLAMCTQWRTLRRPIGPLIAIFLLVLAGLLVVQEAKRFFGFGSLSSSEVTTQLNETAQHTAQGGSSFSPISVGSNPARFPLAFVTIFYRPLPIEVHNTQGVIAGSESLLIFLITVWSWRSVAAIRRRWRTHPYVSYCIGFIIPFVVMFSVFSNFGILARERCQALPLLLALLALPPVEPKPEPEPIAPVHATAR
jgi:hypothetical protein